MQILLYKNSFINIDIFFPYNILSQYFFLLIYQLIASFIKLENYFIGTLAKKIDSSIKYINHPREKLIFFFFYFFNSHEFFVYYIKGTFRDFLIDRLLTLHVTKFQ